MPLLCLRCSFFALFSLPLCNTTHPDDDDTGGAVTAPGARVRAGGGRRRRQRRSKRVPVPPSHGSGALLEPSRALAGRGARGDHCGRGACGSAAQSRGEGRSESAGGGALRASDRPRGRRTALPRLRQVCAVHRVAVRHCANLGGADLEARVGAPEGKGGRGRAARASGETARRAPPDRHAPRARARRCARPGLVDGERAAGLICEPARRRVSPGTTPGRQPWPRQRGPASFAPTPAAQAAPPRCAPWGAGLRPNLRSPGADGGASWPPPKMTPFATLRLASGASSAAVALRVGGSGTLLRGRRVRREPCAGRRLRTCRCPTAGSQRGPSC